MNKTFIELDIDSIVIQKHLRAESGNLTTLENSIRKLGMIYPVLVDRNNILITGGRRIQACRNIGVKRIPVFKFNVDHDSMTALDIRSDVTLCRLPLTTAELERLIELKKNVITGESRPLWSWSGMLSRLRRLFSRAWAR